MVIRTLRKRTIRTRAVSVESRYVRYEIRYLSYKLHYVPSSTVRTKEEEARRRLQVERRKRIGLREECNLATTWFCYKNWRKMILSASRINSEWTQIHLMRFCMRITSTIKRLKTNYKEPIKQVQIPSAWQKNRFLILDFEDRRPFLAEWLELASSNLFSSETAGIGCFFFRWIWLVSQSSAGRCGVRYWVGLFLPFWYILGTFWRNWMYLMMMMFWMMDSWVVDPFVQI